jgi:hemerythrin
MEKNAYPEINEQRNQHNSFVVKIEEENEKFKQGITLVSVEILTFLKDWLVGHIQTLDKKYGVFLNEKGVY